MMTDARNGEEIIEGLQHATEIHTEDNWNGITMYLELWLIWYK